MTTSPDAQQATRPDVADLYRLPPTVKVPEAGRFWGLGREASRSLARAGTFPVPVLALGRRQVCTRASLIAALDPEGTAAPRTEAGR